MALQESIEPNLKLSAFPKTKALLPWWFRTSCRIPPTIPYAKASKMPNLALPTKCNSTSSRALGDA